MKTLNIRLHYLTLHFFTPLHRHLKCESTTLYAVLVGQCLATSLAEENASLGELFFIFHLAGLGLDSNVLGRHYVRRTSLRKGIILYIYIIDTEIDFSQCEILRLITSYTRRRWKSLGSTHFTKPNQTSEVYKRALLGWADKFSAPHLRGYTKNLSSWYFSEVVLELTFNHSLTGARNGL